MKKRVFTLFLTLILLINAMLFYSCIKKKDAHPDKTEHEHVYEFVDNLQEANLLLYGIDLYVCRLCGDEKWESTDPISPETTGIPSLFLTGSLEGISKERTVTMGVSYQDCDRQFDCHATLKIQGSSSSVYDKKNFTIKLYTNPSLSQKYPVDLGWGEQSRYCLKANFIDSSHARNIVSARLYSEILKTNPNSNETLSSLVNGGVIDGYAVLLYLNGEFCGLYTLNIPKDPWMVGMSSSAGTQQAILMGKAWTDSCLLREPIEADFSNGWNLEYCSTADSAWVAESFNQLIACLNDSSRYDLRAILDTYLDVSAAIDTMLFSYFVAGEDNIGKNMLWITYDATQWIPVVYDLDATFGYSWDGQINVETSTMIPQIIEDQIILPNLTESLPCNLLWQKLFDTYREEIKERYFALRETVLSLENVQNAFVSFLKTIPEIAYESDCIRWQNIPNISLDHLEQILVFTEERALLLDDFFESL